ncbi:hypothetical protein GAMM_160041 [Gammaproteobacteria bacterium]
MKKYLKLRSKKTWLGLLGLFTLSVFIFPILTSSTLEVYIGVMPEEVSPLIKSSLSIDKTSGSILVISRSNIRPIEAGGTGELLEQDLGLYDKSLENANNISVTTDSSFKNIGNESDVVRQLAKKIKNNTSKKAINMEDHLIPKFKSKMEKFIDNDGQAIISVAKIGSGHIKRIFIQLPEMGFQASLCYEYGVAILNAICSQFANEEMVFAAAFSGGGSISTETKPGMIESFSNSVGIRAYKIPGKNKYIGKVLISTLNEEITLFQTDPCENQYEALEIARFVFLKLGDIPPELSPIYVKAVLRPGEDQEKAKKNIASNTDKIDINFLKQQLISKLKSGQTSITESIFLGDAEKDAGDNIGKMIAANSTDKYKNSKNTQVVSANMEDDIIFRIYRHIMEKRKSSNDSYMLLRTACDPFRISKEVKEKLQEWIEEREYTLDNYIDAVLWRLSGFNNKFLTKNAHWTFYDAFKNTSDQELFYRTKVSKDDGEPIVVDPFWREIGTDFIVDVLEAGEEKDDIASFRKEFRNMVDVEGLEHFSYESNKTLVLRKKLEKVLEKALHKLNFDKMDGKYKIWVRKGSWSNNPSNDLNSLDFIHGSNADRAFYVSTNFVALIENASEYFKKLMEKQQE